MHATTVLSSDYNPNQWLIEPMLEIVSEVQSQSAWTWKHLGRVARYAVAFGRKVGLDRQEMMELQCAAILHDVGKLRVPPELLDKASALSREEWYSITKHPMASSIILKALALPTPVIKIAQCHHEWFDGSGYPMGLKGEAIPLGARILSIADSYDAMSSNRPYRAALAPEQILAELEKGAGTQFDPTLIRGLRPLIESGFKDVVPTRQMKVVSDDPMLYLQLWFATYPLGWEIQPWPQSSAQHCPPELLTSQENVGDKAAKLVVDGRSLRRLPEEVVARIPEDAIWIDPREPRENSIYRPLHLESVLEQFDSGADWQQASHKTNAIKVLLADPYQLFRQALSRCLDERDDVQIVGEVDSASAYRKALGLRDFQVAIVASDLLAGTYTTTHLRLNDFLLDDDTDGGQMAAIPTIVLVADEDLMANTMPVWVPGTPTGSRVYIPRGEPAEVLVEAMREMLAVRPTAL